MVKAWGLAKTENTSFVEVPSRCINCNRYWLLLESIEKISSGGGNISEGSNFYTTLGCLIIASLVNSYVRISTIGNNTLINDILESIIHPSTVASLVTIRSRTVYKLLFRKINGLWFTFLNDQSWFNTTSGRESPAWTTLSLVFNTSNFFSSYPVDISVDWNILGNSLFSYFQSKIGLFKFLGS